MVFELATGGELFDRILERGSFTEKDAAVIVVTVLSAVAFLHDHDIVHRDLKLQNLMFKDPSADSSLCIVDFGFATRLPAGGQEKENPELLKTMLGTLFTRAPEIFLDKPYKGKPVDMWAVGCIAYTLLCGYSPFHGAMDMADLLDKVVHCRYTFDPTHWSTVSLSAQQFIRSILRIVPDKRLTAHEALQHEWIQSMVPSEYLEYLEMVNEESWCKEKGVPFGSASTVPGSPTAVAPVEDDDDMGLQFNAIARPNPHQDLARKVHTTEKQLYTPSEAPTTALDESSSIASSQKGPVFSSRGIAIPQHNQVNAIHTRATPAPLSSSLSRQLMSNSVKLQPQTAQVPLDPPSDPTSQSDEDVPTLLPPSPSQDLGLSTTPSAMVAPQSVREPTGRTLLALAAGTSTTPPLHYIDTSPRRVPSYPGAPSLSANLVSLSKILATAQSAQDGTDSNGAFGSPPKSPSVPEPSSPVPAPEISSATGIPIPNRRQTLTPPIAREGSSLGQQFSLRDLREFQALATGTSTPPTNGTFPTSPNGLNHSFTFGVNGGRGGSISPHAGLRRRGTPETISSIRRNNSIDRLDGVPFHASTPPSSSPLAFASAAERGIRRVSSHAGQSSTLALSMSGGNGVSFSKARGMATSQPSTLLSGAAGREVATSDSGVFSSRVGEPPGRMSDSPDSEASRYLGDTTIESLRSEPASSWRVERVGSQMSLASARSVRSARILDIIDILEGDSPSRRAEQNLVGTADAIRRYRRTTEEARSSHKSTSYMELARLVATELPPHDKEEAAETVDRPEAAV
ncbi:hypothetical protein HDU93_001938 [Gonapodya sp. JEL0774]|nr:hypothetical protein HDU93_001938 [Gonapodya sp. JEL0774]